MAASLRICSLLPSTTEIVGGLGLADHLCAVTHECDVCPDAAGLEAALAAGCLRVTVSHVDPHTLSQAAIDTAVKTSVSSSLSLYAVNEELLLRAAPTVVLTQTLCDVCAPALGEVQTACQPLPSARVHSFEPHNLHAVGESFVAVADACGVRERGVALRDTFTAQLANVREAAARASAGQPPPSEMLLEWLDPPFDGGSWIPDMIHCAGGVPVLHTQSGSKSIGRSWEEVAAADPDVIVIACCGFGLQRNIEDGRLALAGRLSSLRAWRNGRVYCCDGNRYFARPSQALAAGAALLARLCWGEGAALPFTPREGEGWAQLRAALPPIQPALLDAAASDFQRDGAVCLRSLLSPAQLLKLTAGIEAALATPTHRKLDTGAGFTEDFCLWQQNEQLREVIFGSGLAEAARRLMGSRTARLYHDHLLVKEPGCNQPTPWHQDQPYYNVDGRQSVSFWIPVDPVENGLRFLPGSHAGPLYTPRSFLAQEAKWGEWQGDVPPELLQQPSIGWPLSPGDAVVFTFRTLHSAAGGAPAGGARRRAYSVRFVGEDAVFAPRAYRTSPQWEVEELALGAGAPLEHALFPLLIA